MVMVPPNYEINIATVDDPAKPYPRYSHIARVELGQVMPDVALDRFELFRKRFPVEENFILTLRKVTCYGDDIIKSEPKEPTDAVQ